MEELTLQEKAEELGQLLANTTFPPKVVERILNNLGNMTEGDMDILLESLRNEQDRLFKLAVMMADFAEYVDDKMKIQTETTLQEIKELTAEQQDLMAQDQKALAELIKKAREEEIDA